MKKPKYENFVEPDTLDSQKIVNGGGTSFG
jgi:hypothetical protein